MSRTKRPSAEGVTTSPLTAADGEGGLVHQGDHRRRPAREPATLPLKVHGSLTRATLSDSRGQSNDQVGGVQTADLVAARIAAPLTGPGIATTAVVEISPRR